MGMLTSNNADVVLRRLAGMLRAMYKSNTSGVIDFHNSGVLDDMTINSDGYTGEYPREYMVRISATGTPDALRYSVDGGQNWSVEANITGSSQVLHEGLTVTFGATTGHSIGSTWRFTVCPAFAAERLRLYVASLTDFDILNSMVSSLDKLGMNPSKSWTTYKSEVLAVANALKTNVGGDVNAFLTSNGLLVNAEIRDVISGLTPSNVIAPQTVLATWEYDGDASGTVTLRDEIDTSVYGASKLEVVALTDITGVGAGIATLEGLDFAGDPISKSSPAVFGALTQYGTYDLSIDYPERFRSITAVTVTGGAAGEAFMIRTQEDKRPTL